jgi:hypothetical protein
MPNLPQAMPSSEEDAVTRKTVAHSVANAGVAESTPEFEVVVHAGQKTKQTAQ